MASKKALKEEIFKRLASHGYKTDEYEWKTQNAYKAYLLVLSMKEEIDNDGRDFLRTNTSEIDDDLYEDAIGWLNQLLPYR